MSAVVLTIVLGLPSAILTALLFPLYLQRRAEKRAAAKELEENTDVTLVKLNDALFKQNDRAEHRLAEQAAAHTIEINNMREQHRSEIAELHRRWETDAAEMRRGLDAEASAMKQRYDEEMATLSGRLEACQTKLSQLYEELYELRRLLPPGVNPPRATPSG